MERWPGLPLGISASMVPRSASPSGSPRIRSLSPVRRSPAFGTSDPIIPALKATAWNRGRLNIPQNLDRSFLQNVVVWCYLYLFVMALIHLSSVVTIYSLTFSCRWIDMNRWHKSLHCSPPQIVQKYSDYFVASPSNTPRSASNTPRSPRSTPRSPRKGSPPNSPGPVDRSEPQTRTSALWLVFV